jgi:hypothetical protein
MERKRLFACTTLQFLHCGDRSSVTDRKELGLTGSLNQFSAAIVWWHSLCPDTGHGTSPNSGALCAG